jgi:hypothetical protein
MGGDSSPSRAVVQSDGEGFRMKADDVKREFSVIGPVLQLFFAIYAGADYPDVTDSGV